MAPTDTHLDSATIVDDRHGASSTVVGLGAISSAGKPAQTVVGPPPNVRTTVLPRIELVDGRHVFVPTSRDRYEPLALLGQGGGGRVDKAQDNDIGRAVAVKRLHPELAGSSHLARFVDEIRLIGQLEHPNIVPIHDVGIDEHGEYFFVMKYLEGETLETVIARLAAGDPAYHARYPMERRMEVFLGILDAVHYAHARRIVHRDLKPANIMIGPFGEVMVMDWGIAKRVGAPEHTSDDDAAAASAVTAAGANVNAGNADHDRSIQTQAGSLIGTPLYMSPEQARGQEVDERSDIYSLCVVLYEFLTLHHPLAAKQSMVEIIAGVLEETPTSASFVKSPHQSYVPMDLSWFLRAGLEKDPARRYPSVAAMIDRLHARAEGRIPIQCHITFTKRLTREFLRLVDRHPMIFTVCLAGGMIAGATSLVLRALH